MSFNTSVNENGQITLDNELDAKANATNDCTNKLSKP